MIKQRKQVLNQIGVSVTAELRGVAAPGWLLVADALKISCEQRDHGRVTAGHVTQTMDKKKRRAGSPCEIRTTIATRGTDAMRGFFVEAVQGFFQAHKMR
jgi:hypothetical protein